MSQQEEGSTRAYAEVHDGGDATLHLPHGGSWLGGTEKLKGVRGAAGWYRCKAYWSPGGWWIELGRKVEPRAEAERLTRLADRQREDARTRR
jgi:hypothetical protein